MHWLGYGVLVRGVFSDPEKGLWRVLYGFSLGLITRCSSNSMVTVAGFLLFSFSKRTPKDTQRYGKLLGDLSQASEG